MRDWPYENILSRQRERSDGITMHRIEKGKVVTVAEFEAESIKAGVRPKVHRHHRQRMYVNPKNGTFLLTEGDAFLGKSFKDAWEVNPETGAIRHVSLPFDAEDMCFDRDGLAYLRNISAVVRCDPAGGWREVPWDYGEQREKVHTSSSGDRKVAEAQSALAMPANGGWHHGGMWISAQGHLAVAWGLEPEGFVGRALDAAKNKEAMPYKGLYDPAVDHNTPYQPKSYPGRGLTGRAILTT